MAIEYSQRLLTIACLMDRADGHARLAQHTIQNLPDSGGVVHNQYVWVHWAPYTLIHRKESRFSIGERANFSFLLKSPLPDADPMVGWMYEPATQPAGNRCGLPECAGPEARYPGRTLRLSPARPHPEVPGPCHPSPTRHLRPEFGIQPFGLPALLSDRQPRQRGTAFVC